MKIRVKGQLLNPISGDPAKDSSIRFITVDGFKDVLRGSRSEFTCDHDGNYDFELEIGVFAVFIRFHVVFEKMQTVTVNSETPSPLTMYELLEQSSDEPLTPEQVAYINELTEQSKGAAQVAVDAASSASKDAQQIALDKIAVESARQQVASNTAAVSEKTQTVVSAQTDVTEKANQVSSDAGKVAQDKESVEGTAQDVATAQAVIGTSIDGVYANAAAIVSINDTILRLHPII